MPHPTRRQFLAGSLALAGLTVLPALSRDTPQAMAKAPEYKKYYYSLDPSSNTHRYGWLYTPQGILTKVPVVVLIHGGSWGTIGNVSSLSKIAELLVAKGIAVWNIEYRSLGTGGGWPTTYADVCDAIDHLLVLKTTVAVNLDLENIWVLGHSAGSQLGALAVGQAPSSVSMSALMRNTTIVRNLRSFALASLRGDRATTSSQDTPVTGLVGTGNEAGKRTLAPDGPALPLRGFISLNGVLDVVDSANRSKLSNITTFLGGTPREVPGNYYAANPLTHLPSHKTMTIIQGTADGLIPHGQARHYVKKARARNNQVRFLYVEGARHNDVIYPHRNPAAFSTCMKAIFSTVTPRSTSKGRSS